MQDIEMITSQITHLLMHHPNYLSECPPILNRHTHTHTHLKKTLKTSTGLKKMIKMIISIFCHGQNIIGLKLYFNYKEELRCFQQEFKMKEKS